VPKAKVKICSFQAAVYQLTKSWEIDVREFIKKSFELLTRSRNSRPTLNTSHVVEYGIRNDPDPSTLAHTLVD
jgi:hypothetical protein